MRFLTKNEHFLEVIKGSSFVLLAKVAATVFSMISGLIMARYYGAEVVGILAIINSALSISVIFGVMGSNVAILRLVPEYIERFSISHAYAVYKKVLLLVIFMSSIIGGILYLLAPWIALSIFDKKILISFFMIASPFVLVLAVNSLNSETLRALQNIKKYALMQLFSSVMIVVMLAITTYSFYYRYNPIYIMLGVNLLMMPLLFFMVGKSFAVLKKKKSKISTTEIISLSFPMFLTSVMHLVIGQTDLIMLGCMSTTRDVGIYSIALKLAMLTSFILVAVNSMVAPKFAQLYHSGQMDDLKIVAQNSAKLVFFATFPVVLVYSFLGTYVLKLFGNDFVEGVYVLIFLVLGQFINAAAGSVGYFLDMTGNQVLFQKIVMFGAGLNIFLNFILIPRYGINGAAFASMVSIGSWNIIAAVTIKMKYGFFISYFPRIRKAS